MRHFARYKKSYKLINLPIVCSLQAIICAGYISPVQAQEFFDCKSRPGEYIIKFKEEISPSSGSPTAAKMFVNSQLEATQVREYPEIDPLIETVKSKKDSSEVKSLLNNPEFKSKVEYIQANCLVDLLDHKVAGVLRDPAGKGKESPLSIVGSVIDKDSSETGMFVVSKSSGLSVLDLTGQVQIDDEYLRVPFQGAFTFPSNNGGALDSGMESVATFGMYSFEGEANQTYDIGLFKGFKNKGNGEFTIASELAFAEGEGIALKTVKRGIIDQDTLTDFVALIETQSGKSEIKVIKSKGGNYEISDLALDRKASDIAISELNGDYEADLAVLNSAVTGSAASSSISVYTGGAQGFKKSKEIALPDASFNKSFALSDMNGDGKLDIIAISGEEVAISQGAGNLEFGAFERTDMASIFGDGTQLSLNEVHVGDMDINGANDLVFSGTYRSAAGSAPLSVLVLAFQRDGIKYFRGLSLGEKKVGGDNDLLTLKDVNGDLRDDLIVGLRDQKSLLVILNKPSDNQTEPVKFELEKALSMPLGASTLTATAMDPYALSHVPVLLTSSTGKNYVTLTDSDGRFVFDDVPVGVYSPMVLIDSYFFPDFNGKQIKVDRDITGLAPYAKRKPIDPPASPADKAPNTPNDYGFNLLWGLHNYGQMGGVPNIDVDAPEAWSVTQGQGVIVGVLDSGLDVLHPEIAPVSWRNEKEIPDNKIDDDDNGVVDDAFGFGASGVNGDITDYDFHGTHVAGTIAAAGNNLDGVIGVAPQSKVLGININDADRRISADGILNGVSYLLWAKRNGRNVRVANASFGVNAKCSKFWDDLLKPLNDAGILFVAAAGNDGSDNDTGGMAPANCSADNLLSVANITKHGQLNKGSNYGATTTHVAAPGTDIWSVVPERGYESMSGTSMAAPHVSGVAALVFASNPSMTPAEVKERIIRTAKKVPALAGKVSSGGIASAAAALAGNSSGGGTGGGNTGGGSTGGGSAGSGGSTGGGSTGVGGVTTGVTFSISAVAPKKTTPVRMTFSQNLTPGSVGCFQGVVSPRKKNQSVRATLKGNKLALQLVQKSGKKLRPVPWPAKGKLAVKIASNCAAGVSGTLVDTDSDGKAGGVSRVINLTIGASKKK